MTTEEASGGILNSFQGFNRMEQDESKVIIRLWKIEEDNMKLREEMRELMGLVKGWREGMSSEDGGKTPPGIMEELRDIKVREAQREKENKKLRDLVEKLIEENNKNRQEITTLYKENQELRLTLSQHGAGCNEDMVKSEVKVQLRKQVNSWKEEEREQQKVDMREIIMRQQIEHDENMEKKVVRILKEKENIIRDTVQKKMCVIVFGDKEKDLPLKATRQREELKRAKEIIASVVEEGEDTMEQVEEVYRLGKYMRNGARPMRIRFSTQVAAATVLARTGKLAGIDNMKHIFIRSDMNEVERKKFKELKEEARTKNEERTQEQANRFVWRVVDLQLRRWYFKNTRAEEQH